jgi:hypothetical protein
MKKRLNKRVLIHEKEDCSCKSIKGSDCPGAIYGLGFIGAAIYYISIASSFWLGFLGVLKALVWPAFLVFEALKFFYS